MEMAMSLQLPVWRSATSQTVWLSRLIDAMEKFSRPEWRSMPVDGVELASVRARLARPAMVYPIYANPLGLKN
jgi:hypothetical protein